ncbi:MAG: ribosome recycling factor [Bacilli bacterium]|nr:ribosome recycling factor [Bacilli bacterium]
MNEILMEAEMKMESSIENMEKRFTNVRAGRASASMVNGINVSYYGVDTPLMQLATISIPEARQICIKPYDKSCLSAIEKAIFESNIGLTPNNNGEVIILNIPPLTEDTRKEYVKQVKTMAEETRIALRNIRQDANNDIKKLEITDDDKKSGNNDVQELIDKYNKVVDEKLKQKENELMQI